jgi:G:T/U-mismatch repair DNA glycosylase
MATETIVIDGKETKTLAELLRPGLRAIIVGINQSPVSVLAGHYYQGQLGKRLWRRLVEQGILENLPDGREDDAAFDQGIGFADVVRIPTARAAELKRHEIVAAIPGFIELDAISAGRSSDPVCVQDGR